MLVTSCSSPGFFVTDDSLLLEGPPDKSAQVVESVIVSGSLSFADPDEAAGLVSLITNDLDSRNVSASAIVFAGDNFSVTAPNGGDESRLDGLPGASELRLLGASADDIVLVAGDVEWNSGKRAGLQQLLELQDHVDSLHIDNVHLLPAAGFPGPETEKVGENTIVVTVDSQWWLHPNEKLFGDAIGYELTEAGDFLDELNDVLRKNRNKTVILVMHHPVVSSGIRAGHFSARHHMVPFPIAGSVVAMYRKLFGTPQDMAHHRYREFRKEINGVVSRHENLIIVSSHDTGLQYSRTGPGHTPVHHINVSMNRTGHVTPDAKTVFSSSRPGYVAIERRADETVTARFVVSNGDQPFETVLYHDITQVAEVAVPDTLTRSFPATQTLPINESYDIVNSRLTSFFLGKHYRKTWATPVSFDVFDLSKEHGGLAPIKIGGRGQSVSLRLQGPNDRQYVLRSVDKEAGRAWPDELRNTFANSITQDQISLLHPYAGLVAAQLADAVGVYHTNPRLVYVPDDPLLGPFREDIAGRIMLFEERPDEDLSDLDSFGNTENAVGYRTMFRNIDRDNDYQVDNIAFARARLLDILMSDWDRHEDQWRWAEFETDDDGVLYRPIPRDRDVAFMSMDGLIPRIAQLASLRNWQDFDFDYGFLRGLTRNGLGQDRRLTAEVPVETWVELAEEIVESLDDVTIDRAFSVLPDPVHDLDAIKLTSILRHRRDRLPDVARQFAHILSRDVDVVGSNKHEEFVVERFDDGSTRVTVFKIKKDGERKKQLYNRTFFPNETREIFLFGQGGQDRFNITGEASSAIKVSIIGGTGNDTLVDSSNIRGRSRTVRYYDTFNSTTTPGVETRLKLEDSPAVNRYEPRAYRLNGIKPVAFFGSNKDDGFFIGGGFTRTVHGFRKNPYKSRHTLAGNVATKTSAFNLKYNSSFRSVLERTDIEPYIGIFTPNNIRNFYGLGNDSRNDSSDATFYQARLSKIEALVPVRYHLSDRAVASVTPLFDYTDVRRDTTRFVAIPQPGLNPDTFEDQWYGGLGAGLSINATDNDANPRNGFVWNTDLQSRLGIKNASSSYTTIKSDLRAYFPISYSPQVTIAGRVGGRHVLGSFPFYSASTLGGSTNLRGFRGTRFAGRTSAYYNAELRLQLFRFASFLSYGTVGVAAFSDGGRVWTDFESSDQWHRGHGGSVWAYLFNSVLVQASYARSVEEGTFTMGLGFQY